MTRVRKHVPYDREYYKEWYAKNREQVCKRARARYRAKIKLKIENENLLTNNYNGNNPS